MTIFRNQKGSAVMELALAMPVLALLMLTAVEGSSLIRTHSAVMEASRAAARAFVVQGAGTDIPALVDSLTEYLNITATTTVVEDSQKNTVTVEVAYVYKPFLGDNSLIENFGQGDLVLSTKTVMPVP